MGSLRKPAAEGKQVPQGRADGGDDVLRVGHGAAVHGDAPLYQGHSGFNVAGEGGNSGALMTMAPTSMAAFPPGALCLGRCTAVPFRRPGGSAGAMPAPGCPLPPGEGLKALDALGLVFLDTEENLPGLEVGLHLLDPLPDQISLIQHGAGVRGDVGFAFGAVDQDGLQLSGVHLELCSCGEPGAAQPHCAAVPDGGEKAGIIGDCRRASERDRLPAAHPSQSPRAEMTWPLDRRQLTTAAHLAGDAGVDGSGDGAVRLGNPLAHLHQITWFDCGKGGLADVHGHGKGDCGRYGDPLGRTVGGVLPVGDMDTAEQVQKHDSNSFHGEAEGRSYFCRRKIGYKH